MQLLPDSLIRMDSNYWIGNFSSGKDDERAVASSFLASAEFKQRYGENVSDSTYVNTLYKNVFGRDADTGGLNYWLGQLNSGIETRYEILLGFSESAENKTLFTELTGLG
jgi:serralysin